MEVDVGVSLRVGGAILAVVVLAFAYLAIRASVLAAKRATFGAWLVRPGDRSWIRGVALYGQCTLAWYRLLSFSLRAEVSLPRTAIDVVGGPVPTRDGQYLVVRLNTPEGLYAFALDRGDAAGVISWVNSAPPGIEPS